jgi:hypothetical protein
VYVAINRHGAPNFSIALHTPNGDRNVMDHAEPLAVVRKRMMESAANVDSDPIFEGTVGRQNRSTGRQPKGAHQFGRVRNFHLQFFASGKSASF